METTYIQQQQQQSRPSQSPEGSLVEVSGLGVFLMKDIYDALSSTEKRPIGACPIPRFDERAAVAERGSDSDCSWTHEEEDGQFYFDMHRRLNHFACGDETTMTIPMLSRKERRFVHATAQIMQLGHASLGPQGKHREMVVFKRENKPLDHGAEDAPKKRKRVPKIIDGFRCRFATCQKVFDRASERKKHEQAHQPAITSQFRCLQCDKGFRYKKDLLRHHKVHNNNHERNTHPASEIIPLGESLGSSSSSAGTTSSTLTANSRVPSDNSLFLTLSAFGSRINSPTLKPQHPHLLSGDGSFPPCVLDGDQTWLLSLDDPDWEPADFPELLGSGGVGFMNNDHNDSWKA